jgi:hypothetical protein
MPFTATDRDALVRAIADGRGARSMTFSDQTVVFSSPEEMLALLARMEQDVANAAGTRRNFRLAATRKGV